MPIYEISSIRWSPTMTLHRRSGRVAHQTSRRSSSPSLSRPFFILFFASLFFSRPSVVSAFFLSLFLSRRRYAPLRLHRPLPPRRSHCSSEFYLCEGSPPPREPNNTGKTLDPDRKPTHRSETRSANSWEQRRVQSFVFSLSILHCDRLLTCIVPTSGHRIVLTKGR